MQTTERLVFDRAGLKVYGHPKSVILDGFQVYPRNLGALEAEIGTNYRTEQKGRYAPNMPSKLELRRRGLGLVIASIKFGYHSVEIFNEDHDEGQEAVKFVTGTKTLTQALHASTGISEDEIVKAMQAAIDRLACV